MVESLHALSLMEVSRACKSIIESRGLAYTLKADGTVYRLVRSSKDGINLLAWLFQTGDSLSATACFKHGAAIIPSLPATNFMLRKRHEGHQAPIRRQATRSTKLERRLEPMKVIHAMDRNFSGPRRRLLMG